MNERDAIWLSGLLEGEGCFDLHRRKYPRVRIAMVDRDVVGRAATLFGCRVRLSLRAFPNKPTWHAEIQGPKAVEVMREVLPYMGARRSAKIAEILAAVDVPAGRSSVPGPQVVRPPALGRPAYAG